MAALILKITLEYTHPPVWRRVLVPSRISFYDLHLVIQTVFGWENDHLHGFTDPNHDEIVPIADEPYNPSEEEDNLPIEDYFRAFSWLRYTYDYGDDWIHKVVLEKEDPDYQERFAKVLKAKGDGYAEDSGGVWRSEDRIPFDIEAVNQRLLSSPFTPVEGMPANEESFADEDKQALEAFDKALQKVSGYFAEHPDELMASFTRWLKEYQECEKQQRMNGTPSGMKNPLDKWFLFCDCMSEWNEKEARKPEKEKTDEAEYEQLTLPFVEIPQEDRRSGRGKTREFQIIPARSEHTQAELMNVLKKQEGKDFCKYLCLPAPRDARKSEYLNLAADFLNRNPSYYLYAIPEDSLHWLAQFQKTGIPVQNISKAKMAVAYLTMLGLIEISYHQEGKKEEAVLSFTDEAMAVLELDGKKSTGKLYRDLRQWDEAVGNILQMYGMMELPALFEKYHEFCGTDLNLTEFERFIYWHGRMSAQFLTGNNRETGTAIIAFQDIDLFDAAFLQHQYLKEIPYKPYSRRDFQEFVKYGVSANCLYWDELAHFLKAKGFTEYETGSWIEENIGDVMNGLSATMFERELTETLEERVALFSIDRAVIWRISMLLVMDHGLAGLKGYSRKEFREMTGSIPEELWAVETSLFGKMSHSYKTLTHLREMPEDIQMKLYDVLEESPDEARKGIREIRSQYGDNVELLCLEACYCWYDEDLERRLRLLRRAMKLTTAEDAEEIGKVIAFYEPRVRTLYAEKTGFTDEPVYEMETPYRRISPKIGRNDPCPCGSGKKYKFCCGRTA